MKIAILASGHLGFTCLLSLKDLDIACVFTDASSKSIIDFCSQNNIPLFTGNPRQGKAHSFIRTFEADIIFSINYLFIIEPDLIQWPKHYAFNIHGSLLPKYRGRTPHVWAIINNEKKTGFTVHLIDKGCDTGAIVLQKEVLLDEEMTGADILKQFEKQYPLAVLETLKQVEENTLTIQPQDDSKATCFGVRTPEDGKIEWQWQRERIYNWIRAQADPYPGAFFFYKNEKIIVHKSCLNPQGFHCLHENGTILKVGEQTIVVKTPNGAILLQSLVHPENLIFTAGEILG